MWALYGDNWAMDMSETTLQDAPTNGSEPNARVFGGYFINKNSIYKIWSDVFIKYYADASSTGSEDDACTGTIVAPSTVLSTARCLSNEGLVTDRLDLESTGADGVLYTKKITSTLIHPNYDSSTYANNIALGYVDTPFDVSSTGPFDALPLPPVRSAGKDALNGQFLTVCGHMNPYTTSGFYYISQPTCNVFIPEPDAYCIAESVPVRSNEICARSSDQSKISVCYYDYGAALYYHDALGSTFYLWAVASYTVNDVCAGGPTAYVVIQDAEYDFVNDNLQ
ncbi:uncharacterized protein LOC129794449 [Lutzomyia longipalpis]|uniref:uncharacterized protein LOC129794449 n=1 Tax=Lutzomyia longipalpis TaxID=7200 RepID=UPI0024842586|nr:uncharacterized protein LOC129794449 [Lutzomyia longipalpis]